MKKTTSTLVACALAFSLAIPATVAPDSAAAAKKPKLSATDATIIKGKTKTFTIKNVKKANVKSLSVKVLNKGVCKLQKKVLTKKKVGFVIKGVGGGVSAVDVTLKLKKKQAGKKVFKFNDIMISSGSAEAPALFLSDFKSGNYLLAMTLKAGSTGDITDEATLDNALTLGVSNKNEIGSRNVTLTWYVDGKECTDMPYSGMDAARDHIYRPESPEAEIPEAATGAAALGVVEQEYYCTGENLLSGKTAESNHKIVRIVPQKAIDNACKILADFKTAYPDAKSVTVDDAFMSAFSKVDKSFGAMLGMTEAYLQGLREGIAEVRDNPDLVEENIQNTIFFLHEDFSDVAAYLGVDSANVDTFIEYFGVVIRYAAAHPEMAPPTGK